MITRISLFAFTRADDDENVDLNVEVDGKEIKADTQLLYRMQSFLEKIIEASEKQSRKSHTRWRRKNDMKMSEFLHHLSSTLGNLDKSEIEIISNTIKSELQKRNNSDFKPLFRAPVFRKSFFSSLQTLNAAKTIWKNIAKTLRSFSEKSAKLSDKEEKPKSRTQNQNLTDNFLSRVHSFFYSNKKPVPKEFHSVLDDLKKYSKRKNKNNRKTKRIYDERGNKLETRLGRREKEIDNALRDRDNLINIVKNALRILVFDQYTNYEENNQDIQHQLQSSRADPYKHAHGALRSKRKRGKKTQVTYFRTGSDQDTENEKDAKTNHVTVTIRRRKTTTRPTSIDNDDQELDSTNKHELRMKEGEKEVSQSSTDADKNISKRKQTAEMVHVLVSAKSAPKNRDEKSFGIDDESDVDEGLNWSTLDHDDGIVEKSKKKRKIKTTKTPPRTKTQQKKSNKKAIQSTIKKCEEKCATKLKSHVKGHKSDVKQIKPTHESKDKSTTTAKTSTTTRDPTFEPQSAEKQTTKQKSLFESFREILSLEVDPTSTEVYKSKESKSKQKVSTNQVAQTKKEFSGDGTQNIGKTKKTLVTVVHRSKYLRSNELIMKTIDKDFQLDDQESDGYLINTRLRVGSDEPSAEKNKRDKKSTLSYGYKIKTSPLLPKYFANSNETATGENFANSAEEEKPMLSAESEALYKALEEQEKRFGLDHLLKNRDLLDVRKLNLTFINSKGSTQPMANVIDENSTTFKKI